jgi:hypothetical protein
VVERHGSAGELAGAGLGKIMAAATMSAMTSATATQEAATAIRMGSCLVLCRARGLVVEAR